MSRAVTRPSDGAHGRSPHGTTAVEEAILRGAFAAQDLVPVTVDGEVIGRPRWSERFARLLDAYEAEQVGDERSVVAALGAADLPAPAPNGNLGDAVVRALTRDVPKPKRSKQAGGGADPRAFAGAPGEVAIDDALFAQLFGWTGVPVSTFLSLPNVVKPIWIINILCCAAGFRRNVFGRYFPPAPLAAIPDTDALRKLSEQMNEAFDDGAADAPIPAGFIFFAQFIDHDITLDAMTRFSDMAVDPETITNVREPTLDLDSVYRDGPGASPDIYDAPPRFGYLLVGPTGRDLARNHLDVAIIGDLRNDENTIISQLHLAFLHFHNAVLRMIQTSPVDALWGRALMSSEPDDPEGDFVFAQRMVRWHYQWILVHDYLPRVIHPTPLRAAHAIVGVPDASGVVPSLPPGYATANAFFGKFQPITCCGHKACRPLMPVEFSGAAFRYAHSQVRQRFDINDDRLGVPLFVPRPPGLASFQPVPNTDVVDWQRFFDIDSGNPPQPARVIDTWLTNQLFQLPFAPADPALGLQNLAFRNLRRGAQVFAVPSGESIATTLGVAGISNMSPLAVGKVTAAGLAPKDAPLWFYCLGEAEANGGQLGPVGGLLVAVTLLRLLKCDPKSYVNGSSWAPVLIPSNPGKFTMADLARIATDEMNDAFPGA